MRNILVTGIPRSGTTLTAALIDSLPDTVCLGEPAWQVARSGSAAAYARRIAADFARLRQQLLSGEAVPDRRSPRGGAPTDYFSRDPEARQAYALMPLVRSGLSPDFTLAVKHNGPYLAALKALLALENFRVVAVVRHPVETLHSWRTLDLPISRGEMPGAMACWPRMAALAAAPMDLLEKQVRMYDLMCERLYNLRENIRLLRYEELLENPALLSRCLDMGGVPPAAAQIKKSSRQVPESERRLIAGAMRRFGSYYARFYPEA